MDDKAEEKAATTDATDEKPKPEEPSPERETVVDILSTSQSHIATVKNLGVMHEFQVYLGVADKCQEKSSRKKQVDQSRTSVLSFATEMQDLPPKIRALFIDNKCLKDKVRKFKQRAADLEKELGQEHAKNLVLEDTVAHLKKQLVECSRSVPEVLRETHLKQQLEERSAELTKLQKTTAVLQSKLDVDAKLHKHAVAAVAKESEDLRRHLHESTEQLQKMDMELRARNLEVKKLQRKLVPIRTSAPVHPVQPSPDQSPHSLLPPYPLLPPTVQAPAQPSPTPQPAPPPSHCIHLMLCVIQDTAPGPPDAPPPVPASPPAAEPDPPLQPPLPEPHTAEGLSAEDAAVLIQSRYKGYTVRKQMSQARKCAAGEPASAPVSEEQQPAETAEMVEQTQQARAMKAPSPKPPGAKGAFVTGKNTQIRGHGAAPGSLPARGVKANQSASQLKASKK